MNEDGTPIVEQEANIEEPSTENILEADGGETTSPEEVAKLLNLPAPAKAEEEAVVDEDKATRAQEEAAQKEADEAKAAEVAKLEANRQEKEKSDEAAKLANDNDADVPTFELEVEDANGDKFTLKPGDDLEKILKDFEPKSNGQIFAVLQALSKLEDSKAKYDSEQETKGAEAEKLEKITAIQTGWDEEVKALQGEKRIPITVDGKSNERVDEVFKFMSEENTKRLDANKPPITTFEDALDKLELRENKEAEIKKNKEEKELAKKRGSIVGGSSAPVTNGGPVYKGGARNANEAIRSLGLLK